MKPNQLAKLPLASLALLALSLGSAWAAVIWQADDIAWEPPRVEPMPAT